jgi:hypothetical protein
MEKHFIQAILDFFGLVILGYVAYQVLFFVILNF